MCLAASFLLSVSIKLYFKSFIFVSHIYFESLNAWYVHWMLHVCVCIYMIIYMCMWGAHVLDICVHAHGEASGWSNLSPPVVSSLPFETGSLPDFILSNPATLALPVSASPVLDCKCTSPCLAF